MTYPAIETDGSAALLSGANTIFLDNGSGTEAYSRVIVWLDDGSSPVNLTFNPGATASSSNCGVGSGATVSYGMSASPPVGKTNQINYYCSAGSPSGNINWMAW